MANKKENPFVMTVSEASELLGMDPQQIREGIENKSFDFGICCKSRRGTKIYKISRRKIYDFLGIDGAST